ncbi:MAG: response regulator transcription factor [Planctomycetota bacterium]|jgi:DNA-binding NarL/FixJ family response regulator|nr:DNA-binding response regulator [Candidatus Woesearchaeota archaeon]MDP6384980.1 response regulator transcription factor [Planctomycetota bacterium]
MNTEPKRIRVFLLDDQAIMRAGIRSLLTSMPEIEIVGDSGEPRAAMEQIGLERPDVVLLDITMPELSGIDAIPQIRKQSRSTKIVMLSHHEGQTFVDESIKAGADGYLSKDSDPEEMGLAIRSVHAGNAYVSPKVSGTLLNQMRGGPRGTDKDGTGISSLTPREREVFQLLAVGKSNKQVAFDLGMSLSTAKKHRENLQRKLNVHSAAELARLAIREGLLST